MRLSPDELERRKQLLVNQHFPVNNVNSTYFLYIYIDALGHLIK